MNNIPKDWELVKIEDIAEVKGGKRLPKGYSLQVTPNGFPYITVSDMYMGGVSTENIKYVPNEIADKIRSYKISENDLFISVAGTLGLVGKVPEELNGANLTENADKITDIRINKEYLYQVLISKIIQDKINSEKTTNAQPKLALTRIKKFAIPMPTNHLEIDKIASILSTWDKAIELKEKLIEQKKEQKTGLIETLLSGKKRINGFNGEWKQVELKEIAYINKESLSSNTNSNYEFCYYDISSVENGNVKIQKDLIKFLDAPSRARRVFRKNDILMSTVRPNLKGFAFIDFEVNDAICSTGFAVITAEEVATNKFIYYNLFSKGIETQIEKLIVGSNYPAINTSDVGNLKIYYPLDHNERQQIVDIIYCADKELKLLQLELKFLKEQKQALMQQLLTGKIRVKV